MTISSSFVVAKQGQEKRVALVIGNSDYSFSPLINPSNDAKDIATALKKNNFDVVQVLDATHEQIDEAILTFGKKLSQADVGLFFYAGHGIQANGRNYIIPVDAVLNKQSDLKYRAVDVGRVLDEMAFANSGVNIVILDACRNNSLPRSFRSARRGLAIVSDSPKGTFIAYSTAPGKVAADGSGRNSPYSSALIKSLGQKQSSLETVFKRVARNVEEQTGGKQIPWFSSSVTGDFYFNLNVIIKPDQISLTNTAPKKTAGNLIELKFWDSIEKNPSVEKYQLYLDSYPQGHFATIAKMEIMSKQNKPKVENASIPELLNQCENFLRRNQLTTGVKGNAYSCYHQLLFKYPDNKEVASDANLGILNIVKKYAQWAEQELTKKNTKKVTYYIKKIKQVNSKSPHIERLEKQLQQQILSLRNQQEKRIDKTPEITQNEILNHTPQNTVSKSEKVISESMIETPTLVIKPKIKQASKKLSQRNAKLLKQLQNNMVHVKAGCFTMGYEKKQNSFSFFKTASVTGYGKSSEKFNTGEHEVCLSNDFLMSKFELTQQIWQAVMKHNPAHFKQCGKHCPIERVSWRDVKKFIIRLNSVATVKFRLPTEAEWEYVARAGQSKNQRKCHANGTHAVGVTQPNSWGFYDLSGNVWEWVEDWYGPYAKHKVVNPIGPGSGSKRVIRGGSWLNTKKECNAYARKANAPFSKKDYIGFRLAADLN